MYLSQESHSIVKSTTEDFENVLKLSSGILSEAVSGQT